jgi:hypothetical protein
MPAKCSECTNVKPILKKGCIPKSQYYEAKGGLHSSHTNNIYQH